MATWFLSILVALACMAGAQTRPSKTAQTSPKATPAKAAKAPPKTTSATPRTRPAATLPTISVPCAVLYWPNEQRIEELKKQVQEPDSSDFYTPADDMMFYTAQTREYLQKRKIKIVETDAPRLRFRLADGSTHVIDLHKKDFAWGLLLFDGRHMPKDADLVDPAPGVKAVFHR
jgi:hypothetical protein